MEFIDILNQDVVNLLERNNLLTPLVIGELRSSIINKVHLDETAKENAKQFFMQERKFANEEQFNNWLNKNSLVEEEFLSKLYEPIKIQKYSLDNFSNQIHSHFLSRKSNLDQVTYSLIRVQDPYLAHEIYQRLESNEDNFANLATQYSEGTEKTTMGIVGPIPISMIDPEIADVLKKSKTGELNQPFRVNGMWFIVRLGRLIEAILDPVMEARMSLELFDLAIQDESKSIIKNLKQRIFPENKLHLTT